MTKYFTAEFKLEAAKLVVDQKYRSNFDANA